MNNSFLLRDMRCFTFIVSVSGCSEPLNLETRVLNSFPFSYSSIFVTERWIRRTAVEENYN